ncbi:hypothetical protein MUG91_G126n10 [Manis pentadactyla]|nr:hypothetical protein MUG91_G126n10 [Manis pentadactyla]
MGCSLQPQSTGVQDTEDWDCFLSVLMGRQKEHNGEHTSECGELAANSSNPDAGTDKGEKKRQFFSLQRFQRLEPRNAVTFEQCITTHLVVLV